MLELALITMLADGRAPEPMLDRIARTLLDWADFSGMDWDQVLALLEALRPDAPLFSDARDRVTDALMRSGRAEAAIRLALGAFDDGPAEDALVIVSDVANRLSVPLPTSVAPLPRFQRCSFDDPEDPSELPLHASLERAAPQERRLLLYKLTAARACLVRLGPTARIVALGQRRPQGPFLLRSDVLIDVSGARYWCRFLAAGEALHPGEHRSLSEWVDSMELGHRVLIAFEERMAPHDAALIAGLDPNALLNWHLGQWQRNGP